MMYRNDMFDMRPKVVEDEMRFLLERPDKPKERLPMYSYWSQMKVQGFTNDATIDRLVLDYDSGISVRDAVKPLGDVQYWWYQTSSSMFESPRFRVIVPLKREVYASDLRNDRNDLLGFFKGSDNSTFAIGRWFYVPSKCTRDGREVLMHVNRSCNAFDFYAMFKRTPSFFTDLCSALRSQRFAQRVSRGGRKDVSCHPSVVEYLTTPFPNRTGNGGRSDIGLYVSIRVCMQNNDSETLDKVIQKALSQGWTQQQIRHKMQ